MLKIVLRLLGFCLLGLHLSEPVVAAQKVAFLVGIKTYDQADVLPELANAEKDVTDIAVRLKNHNFKVHTMLGGRPGETGYHDILDKWAEVVSTLEDGDLILFYFAGHAIELRGRNYLQPKDASVKGRNADDIGDISTTSIDFRTLLDKLADYQEEKKLYGVFVLDSCRENPIKDKFPDAADLRTVGLVSEPKLPRDVFVLYSAGIGQQAWDGEPNTHSPFAAELIELLDKQPDLATWSWTRIAEHLRVRVRERVVRARTTARSSTDRRLNRIEQTPAYYSQLRVGRRFDGGPATATHFRYSNNHMPVDIQALEPRDSFTECAFCPVMVVVPSGEGQAKAASGKYAIGKFEVTRREWAKCVEDGDCAERLSDIFRSNAPATASHPITNVSWQDAQSFTRWLSTKTKARYRLPTDAEWEHAARAGANDAAFVFGNDEKAAELCQFANGADREIGVLAKQYSHCSDGVGRVTSRVGAYRANAFGLHDVHGNVWEWVASCWPLRASPAGKNGNAVIRQNCPLRVARGGSWASGAQAMRLDRRNRFPSGHDRQTLGLRVMRVIDTVKK